MKGRTLLAFFVSGLVLSGTALAENSVQATPTDKQLTRLETAHDNSALGALEEERVAAIEAFDWGQRADFGERLLAYNELMKDFELRELELRAGFLDELGLNEDAARLRSEYDNRQAGKEALPQAVEHDAPVTAAGEVVK
jgi:hypothetical protein